MRHDLLEVHQSDPDSCLASFRAAVIDGLDGPSEASKVGTLVHRVAEVLTMERAEHVVSDSWETARRIVREQAAALRLSPAGVVDALEILERCLAPESRLALWPQAGWSGRAEYRWGLVEDGDDFAFVEDPKEPVYAAGTIDLVEWAGNAVRLVDWKTSRMKWGADDAWESWQARLYAFAMLRRFPDAPSVEFRYGMLRHGYMSGSVDFIRGDPWEWGVAARLRATREQRERAVASGEWPATPGPWCSYCPIRWKCDAFRSIVDQGDEIPEDLSPTDLARRLGVLKTAVRDVDRACRAIVDDTGRPIPLGDVAGQVLGHKVGDAVECVMSYEQTMDELRMYGLTREQEIEHFRFVRECDFASRVKKVAREVLRIDRASLEGLVVPIAKTEFRVFTPEPTPPADREATLDEIDAAVDRAFDGA